MAAIDPRLSAARTMAHARTARKALVARSNAHGMNLQVIAGHRGDILWFCGALPGSVHDKKAEPAPRGALLYSRFSREESGGYSWV